jgi:hypothetical protein
MRVSRQRQKKIKRFKYHSGAAFVPTPHQSTITNILIKVKNLRFKQYVIFRRSEAYSREQFPVRSIYIIHTGRYTVYSTVYLCYPVHTFKFKYLNILINFNLFQYTIHRPIATALPMVFGWFLLQPHPLQYHPTLARL